MTGKYPVGEPVPTANEYPGSIFTLLADQYSMDVTEPVTSICPRGVCGEERNQESTAERWSSLASDLTIVGLHTVLPEGLRSGLPAVDVGFKDFGRQAREPSLPGVAPAARRPLVSCSWERFVAGLGTTPARPPLHFYHSLLPHIPWEYVPTGKQYAVGSPDPPGHPDAGWITSAVARNAQQRFLLQLRFVDRQLGQLTRRLRATGLFDRSLVVITADHGVSFRARRNRRAFDHDNPADIASVPLFVKLPGRQRLSRRRLAGSHDRHRADARGSARDQAGVGNRRTIVPGRFSALAERAARFRRRGGIYPRAAREVTREDRREMVSRFGERDGGAGIFASESSQDLLGRTVVAGALASRPGAAVQVDQASLLGDVNLASPVLPVYLTGSIEGAGPNERVAIVVNSRIRRGDDHLLRGGGREVRGDDPSELSAAGLQLDRFRRSRGARRRHRAWSGWEPRSRSASSSSSAAGVSSSSGAAGVSFRSRTVPRKGTWTPWTSMRPSSVAGRWTARRRTVADRVVVFAGRRFLGSAPPLRSRGDLVKPFGAYAARAGFQVTIPVEGVDEDAVRVFAVSDGRASELELPR